MSSFDRSCYVSRPRRASNANHCVVTFLAPTRHNTQYSKTMSTKYSETKDTKYSKTTDAQYSNTTGTKYSETISIDAELIIPFFNQLHHSSLCFSYLWCFELMDIGSLTCCQLWPHYCQVAYFPSSRGCVVTKLSQRSYSLCLPVSWQSFRQPRRAIWANGWLAPNPFAVFVHFHKTASSAC